MSGCGRSPDPMCSCPVCVTYRVVPLDDEDVFAEMNRATEAALAARREDEAEEERTRWPNGLIARLKSERDAAIARAEEQRLRAEASERNHETCAAALDAAMVISADAIARAERAERELIALVRESWPHTTTLFLPNPVFSRCCGTCEQTWPHPGPENHAGSCRYVDAVEFIAARPDLAEAYGRYRVPDYDELCERGDIEAISQARRRWASPLREDVTDDE